MESPSAFVLVFQPMRSCQLPSRAIGNPVKRWPASGERQQAVTGGEISPWAVAKYVRCGGGRVNKSVRSFYA